MLVDFLSDYLHTTQFTSIIKDFYESKTFFSIIIPVYNTEQYIQRYLVSCIEQTFKDIEIIVVDDCGQDDAINIAQKYAKNDSRIQIVRNSKNLGVFASRPNGGKLTKGEYIIYLDSDDFISTQMCQILYQTIQSHNNEGGGGIRYYRFHIRNYTKT